MSTRQENNLIAILPSDEKWLTGGVFYDYELMKNINVNIIFKITSNKKEDYIGIVKFLNINIQKNRKNILIIDTASIIYLLPILLLKSIYRFELVTLHMHLQGDKNSLKQMLFKKAILNLSDKIITISEYSNTELLPRKANLIIYPPLKIIEKIDTAKDGSHISLLFVGSIIRRKNIDLLIDLMHILDDRFKLVICGNIIENDYYNELNKKIKKYELLDKVEFIGKVSDEELTKRYNLCDIFIFPSILEGFGMVNIEAMYLNIPVFASDIGPHREIIEDGVDGFLFDVNNLTLLKEKINIFINDKTLQKSIKLNAKEKAKQFIWKKEDLILSFNKVINEE
jgi:glycosyltransferase involved in cell wall biosynthesis